MPAPLPRQVLRQVLKPWPLQTNSDVPTSVRFPALISHFRDWRRILPSHVARVQPPRKHHYPAPRAGLRGGAVMSSFAISRAGKHVTLNFRSARMAELKADVLVLGAGMVGVSAALHLQKRGRNVV